MPVSVRAHPFIALAAASALAVAALLRLSSPSDETIRATGTVVPAIEVDVTAPIGARIVEVHARAGDELARGGPIVSLDLEIAEQHAERLERDLAVRNSQQLQAQVALQNSLTDVDTQIDRKALELRSLNIRLASHRRLLAEGQGSDEQVEMSLLAVQQAEFELGRLQEARWRLKQADAAEVDTVAADRRSLTLDALENRDLLELRTVRADRPALVVAVLARPGESVAAGDAVARIADLSAFQVWLTAEDLDPLLPGTPAIVLVGGVELTATAAVSASGLLDAPGTMLTLADPSYAGLRNGLRVEVRIPR